MSIENERLFWVDTLCKISYPVLSALNERRLVKDMPIEQTTQGGREEYTYLEALGRTLSGISPWLELGADDTDEGILRAEYAKLARSAIDSATDPLSFDKMNFSKGMQPIVDAAFLAHALLRSPTELIDKLDSRVKGNLINAFCETREGRKPGFCNWLLFSAMIESALHRLGHQWDHMRVDYAIRQHEQWYLGDGIYGDGPRFHWDYYNSFVIQPMLLDVLEELGDYYPEWKNMKSVVTERAVRYATVLERLISPEGTFPIIGRSLAYRFGVFQLLGQIALMHKLPETIIPSQVRCALTMVIQNTMSFDNFTPDGWLKIGVCGSQPGMGENYISTGSLYLCLSGLIPLGLPADDVFWTGQKTDWTSRKIWNGKDMPADYSI